MKKLIIDPFDENGMSYEIKFRSNAEFRPRDSHTVNLYKEKELHIVLQVVSEIIPISETKKIRWI